MGNEKRRLVSTNTAAYQLDCSRSTVLKLMRNGIIRWVYVGKDRRIPAEEVDRIVAEGASTKA